MFFFASLLRTEQRSSKVWIKLGLRYEIIQIPPPLLFTVKIALYSFFFKPQSALNVFSFPQSISTNRNPGHSGPANGNGAKLLQNRSLHHCTHRKTRKRPSIASSIPARNVRRISIASRVASSFVPSGIGGKQTGKQEWNNCKPSKPERKSLTIVPNRNATVTTCCYANFCVSTASSEHFHRKIRIGTWSVMGWQRHFTNTHHKKSKEGRKANHPTEPQFIPCFIFALFFDQFSIYSLAVLVLFFLWKQDALKLLVCVSVCT